jgi:hypothetical protein
MPQTFAEKKGTITVHSPMKVIISLILLTCFPVATHAASRNADSIEWVTDRSPVIAEYKVNSTKAVEQNRRTQVNLLLESKLRGAAPKTAVTHFAVFKQASPGITLEKAKPQGSREPRIGDRILLFFQLRDDPGTLWPSYAINLTSPHTEGFKYIAFTGDFKILKTGNDVRAAVKARLKVKPGGTPIRIEENWEGKEQFSTTLRAELSTEAGDSMWRASRSGCGLRVPKDLAPAKVTVE